MGIFEAFLPGNKALRFWSWFAKHDDKLFDFESNHIRLFALLSRELSRVHRNVTFELGPAVSGKREFVISAGGTRAAFPAVEELFATKPESDRWIFVKYRPRRNQLVKISMNELTVLPEDIRFVFFDDDDPRKIGLLLFINGFDKKKKNAYHDIAYLFLDEAIGEYDVETFVGAIDIHDFDSEYFDKSIPIEELAPEFDAFKAKSG
jgi:hypothetical protein